MPYKVEIIETDIANAKTDLEAFITTCNATGKKWEINFINADFNGLDLIYTIIYSEYE
jgi:hypothetical protein